MKEDQSREKRDQSRMARLGRLPFPVIFMLFSALLVVILGVSLFVIFGVVALGERAGLPVWPLIPLVGIPLCANLAFRLRREVRRDR